MTTSDQSDLAPQPELEEVLAAYLRAEEQGASIDQDQWIRSHPALADELKSFFRNRSAMQQLAGNVQAYELPTEFVARDAYPAAGEMLPYVGDYELLSEIARGGMGVVYRARQLSLNRIVALKMILGGKLATRQDVERFRAEAEAAANLDHHGIVPIYEVGEHEGKHYFSMAYIDGGSLAARMPALVSNPKAAVPLLIQVCRAVHFAHQRGILHRDLKPANILLDAGGTPHVTDFGLAKQVDRDSGVTQPGAILGTPSYMAPEQARAEKVLSTAADVYALGAILYELLTGRPPFRGANALETLRQVLDQDPPRPRTVSALIDRDLETIALKCLEKEPSRRYESAAALAADLERWQRSEPILARRAWPIERLQKWITRRPALAAMALVAAVLCGMLLATGALGFAGVVWQWRNVVAQQQKTNEALYVSRVALAGSELARDNVGPAEFMLDQCDENLRGWEWHYLQRAAQGDLVTLTGCGGMSHSPFAISPDGRRIAGQAAAKRSNLNDEIAVYDADSGAVVWRAQCNHSPDGGHIGRLFFSPDGKELYGGVYENHPRKETTLGVFITKMWSEYAQCVRVWDAATGRELRTVLHTEPGRSLPGWNLALSPDGKWLARRVENTTTIHDALTGEEKQRLPGRYVQFAPAGKRFSASNQDLLIDADNVSGAYENLLSRQPLTFSLDGQWRAVAESGTLEVRRADTGTTVWKAPRYGRSAQFAFSLDGKRLAGASAADRVTIWESATGKEIDSFSAPVSFLRRLVFTADDNLRGIVIVADKLKVWNAAPLQPDRTALKHSSPLLGIAFSPGGGKLAVLTATDGALVWELSSQQIIARTGGAWSNTSWTSAASIAFSPDGKLIACPSAKNEVLVFDLATGSPRLALAGHTKPVGTVAFSPQDLLASAGDDGTVRTWNIATGAEVAVYAGHQQAVGIVAFHPSGKWVASTSWGAHTHASDPQTGNKLGQQSTFYGAVVRFSPDGRQLAQALREIEIRDVPDNGRLMNTFNATRKYRDRHDQVSLMMSGHVDNIAAVVYSQSGKRLFTGDENGTIKVWDTTSGQETFAIPGNGAGVTSLDTSGQRLAAAYSDGAVRFFDGTPLLEQP